MKKVGKRQLRKAWKKFQKYFPSVPPIALKPSKSKGFAGLWGFSGLGESEHTGPTRLGARAR
jgi:hypothetical protein